MNLKISALLAALIALAGCSKAPAASPTVAVTDAWCRAAAAGAPTGGCYVTLTAARDDRLIAVETPAAERVEIHQMDMTGGVMRMGKAGDGLALPAGEAVRLQPGSLHLMLIRPRAPLAQGGTTALTLRFEKAKPVTLAAPIRNGPAAEPAHR
jgi:copper(I)-binding protein